MTDRISEVAVDYRPSKDELRNFPEEEHGALYHYHSQESEWTEIAIRDFVFDAGDPSPTGSVVIRMIDRADAAPSFAKSFGKVVSDGGRWGDALIRTALPALLGAFSALLAAKVLG